MFDFINKENETFYKDYAILKKSKKDVIFFIFIFILLSVISTLLALLAYYNSRIDILIIFFLLSLIFLFPTLKFINLYLKIDYELFIYKLLIDEFDENFEKEYLEKLIHCKTILENGATYYEVQREYINLRDTFNKNFIKLSIGACKQTANDLDIIEKEMINCKLK